MNGIKKMRAILRLMILATTMPTAFSVSDDAPIISDSAPSDGGSATDESDDNKNDNGNNDDSNVVSDTVTYC